MKMHDPKMLHAIIQALAKVPSKHFGGEEDHKMPDASITMVGVGKPGDESAEPKDPSEIGEPAEHDMPDMENSEDKHSNSMKKLHAMKGR